MNHNNIIITLTIILVVLIVVGIFVFSPFMSKTGTVVAITSSNELNWANEFSILLSDINGNPIANQTINITFDNGNGVLSERTLTTDSAGIGVLVLNELSSGQYTVNVYYGGNNNYLANSTSQKLTIAEKVVQTQTTSSDNNYFNGHPRSDFSKGQQAAIDDARAHGYATPADYYKATGKSAGQGY